MSVRSLRGLSGVFGRDARLRQIEAVLDKALSGELTAATGSNRADRLGDVERRIDALIHQLRSVAGTAQFGVNRIKDARTAAANTHKQMLDAAEMTAGQAYDVGVTAAVVSENIGVVASATVELNATISEVARHADAAADIAQVAAEQGEVAAAGMHELTAAVEAIDAIATAITAIASRTHLLALNARIEAQRAGSAGRGFSVVATEVNDLARQTAQATEQVREIVAGIKQSSRRASTTIEAISSTVSSICDSTASIASAVSQQTMTTGEIGRVSTTAAQAAQEISARVSTVHDRAREVAYTGAQKDASKSEELARIEEVLRQVVDPFKVGEFVVEMSSQDNEKIDQAELNRQGTSTINGVTSVRDYVVGPGLHEFQYTGAWLHGDGYATDVGGDAYCSVAGDVVTMRFAGRRIRFYGSVDKQQGMAEISIDGGSPELVDFYAPTRAAHTLLWESADLPNREHTFKLTVSPKKNPKSTYFWASVAKVEIVH